MSKYHESLKFENGRLNWFEDPKEDMESDGKPYVDTCPDCGYETEYDLHCEMCYSMT